MTNRLADAIMRDSFTNLTFSDVGKRYHVSTSTVKLLFEERGAEYWAQYHFEAPKVLGIDEVHLNNASMKRILPELPLRFRLQTIQVTGIPVP